MFLSCKGNPLPVQASLWSTLWTWVTDMMCMLLAKLYLMSSTTIHETSSREKFQTLHNSSKLLPVPQPYICLAFHFSQSSMLQVSPGNHTFTPFYTCYQLLSLYGISFPSFFLPIFVWVHICFATHNLCEFWEILSQWTQFLIYKIGLFSTLQF